LRIGEEGICKTHDKKITESASMPNEIKSKERLLTKIIFTPIAKLNYVRI